MKGRGHLDTVFKMMGPYRRRLPLVMGVSLLDAALGGLGLGMILPVFQALLHTGADNGVIRFVKTFTGSDNSRVLLALAAVTVAMFALKAAVTVARAGLIRQFAEGMRAYWIRRIGRRYLLGSYASLAGVKQGMLLNTWVVESQSGARFLQAYLSYWTMSLQALVLFLVGMVAHWQAMLVVAAGALLVVGGLRLRALNVATVLGQRKLDLHQRLSAEMTESLANLRELKLLTIEEGRLNTIAADAGRLCSVFVRIAILSQLPSALGEFLAIGGLMGFLAVGIVLIGMDPKTLIPFLAFFLAILYRLMTVGTTALSQRMKAMNELRGLETVGHYANDDANLEDRESGVPIAALDTGLSLENVTFGYGSDDGPVLDHLDLVIPRGKVTFIVGPSGSGKSTVLDLLMRLHEPAAGRIVANGRAAADFNLIAWRHLFGYVSQEAALFNGTILENLTLTRPEATQAEIEEACRLSGAHDFIGTLPKGYDTPVGDRGFTVSGGQRKRIAIARAIMCDPQVLILDEATTSFEESMERDLLRKLRQARPGLTIIQITHRLQTAADADLVVLLSNGRVIARGGWSDIRDQADHLALTSG